jgi:voltage-dependent calcium channel N type alpha-1B
MPDKKSTLRYHVWKFVESTGFEMFILGLIVVNTIILMMKWPNQSKQIKNVLKYLNIVFTGFFGIESLLKIVAYGLKVFNLFFN